MELNYFRDRLFDLLNDSEEMGIADLNTDERNGLFTVRTKDGNLFEIVCRRAVWGLGEPQQASQNIPKGYSGSLLAYAFVFQLSHL